MNLEDPSSRALLAFLESELSQNRALGDYQTMLRALWNKRETPTLSQIPTKLPQGYRSLAVREYVRQNFGALLPYWGPTAIRGDLTEKKAHISTFISLVNELSNNAAEINRVFELAAKMVADHINAKSPIIQLPIAGKPQQILTQLLAVKSRGRVQQGLVYALLKILYEETPNITVRTKAVFAGDAQSGQRGDIDVSENNGKIRSVFEVKAQQLNLSIYEDVVRTHTVTGERNYPVFIVAESFQAHLFNEYQDVFIIRLRDFCLTILAEIVSSKNLSSDESIRRVLDVYNSDFCDLIQQDRTLRVDY
ncbi:hypothetical protein H6F50_08470 [Coleofasciculus sp. FACHB-712]|uniref:hypothetical protein n=1 Tax=Cyanophyceae TaxID=3028117 RepID=UPI0016871C60|nr:MULTISPECIES: hypothetical protein [unclassified Coleofasciculus]MBD1839790.1 hypothetical protein [Coleofasciculus sp. FACHB-501]MBD1892514.1 hypothetical protein [Coleofasciculus sp. FACHB-SPT9]MBD1895826.1 hypothetical protein [Coleofasciculus sp. FACHB-129]MBD1942389.1 hypothetical protein [Coleofasciculus sp. FACHB-712]